MPIISTIEAKCKDCYKCVRACPVKAIRITGETAGSGGPGTGAAAGRPLHAQVVKERCILDGECLRVCPQKAKRVRPDADRVRHWLEAGEKVVVSLAPSFAAAFELDDPMRLVGALRKLGFATVAETAVGAELVAAAVREEVDEAAGSSRHRRSAANTPVVATACPVVVNLLETVYPDALPYASRVVSPMIAHGHVLKETYPGAKVVFIGPCVAKKDEAERPQVAGAVDAVLTYTEIQDWLFEDAIDVRKVAPAGFDGYQPQTAGLFPVEGGLLRTASLPSDLLSGQWLAASGMENCREILASLVSELPPPELEGVRLIELLACRGGCVAGPALPDGTASVAVRRQRLLRFAESRTADAVAASRPNLPPESLHRDLGERRPTLTMPTEAEIKDILARVGKRGPEDELNCGVCGYATCREKAVAVHQGMAESDMCLPYMRDMAESMSNLVISAAPYGVVTTDHDLRITYANRSFRTMFKIRSEAHLVGRKLSEIIDDAYFARTRKDLQTAEIQVSYPDHNLLTRQTIFYLAQRDAVVGVFLDLTSELKQRDQLEQLRGETIGRAREVIAKQMKVAQEIAGLLGETTADTKVILTKLIEFINKEDAAAAGRR